MTSNLLHRYVGAAATCCILSMASGCVGEIEGDEPRQEPVAEAAEALSSAPVTSYQSTRDDLLSWTNGKKTVATSSGLHTVWADGGSVYYASSTDGITWSTITTIDSASAYKPAIAAASNGTLGVLYIRDATASMNSTFTEPEGDVYYRWKSSAAGWSTAFKVTSDASSQVARAPTITAHGTTMHMAWASADSVHYLSFPAAQIAPLATAASIQPTTPCFRQIDFPSIAASDDDAGTGAVVRIAYYQQDSGCATAGFGWIVDEKPAMGYWNTVHQSYDPWTTGAPFSLSLVANKTTGDFYLVTSHTNAYLDSTDLHYQNANDHNSTWRSEQILPRFSVVDVATTMKGCDPILRIVYSDFQNGGGWNGPTYYRTGIWAGAAAAAPTWTNAAPVLLDPNGSFGTALFWEKAVSTFSRQKRVFYSLFETETFPGGSPNYSLIDAYDTVANISGPACIVDREL
jgi:hypothetical protein